MADHGSRGARRLVVFDRKTAAPWRREAKEFEEITGHALPPEDLGMPIDARAQSGRIERDGTREGRVVVTDLFEESGGKPVVRPAFRNRFDKEQLLGTSYRQGPEDNGVDETEDRGVRSDSKRQREDYG